MSEQNESEHKGAIEQLLDVVFYAPLGLVLNVEEVLPNLVQRGRQQVAMAKMFGQFAVQQGQTEAAKAVTKVRDQATARTRPIVNAATPSAPPAAAPAAAASPLDEPAPVVIPAGPVPDEASLSIPGYDSLSASQVIPRLEGLSADELVAVQTYEATHRGRKTILSKIAQLQG